MPLFQTLVSAVTVTACMGPAAGPQELRVPQHLAQETVELMSERSVGRGLVTGKERARRNLREGAGLCPAVRAEKRPSRSLPRPLRLGCSAAQEGTPLSPLPTVPQGLAQK